MNLLPQQKFDLIVAYSIMEVRERLAANVGPKNFWGVLSTKREHLFNGVIEDESFTLFKNVHTRNTFVPVLYGALESEPTGTRIHVKMKLQPVVNSILLAGLAAVIIFMLALGNSFELNKIIMLVAIAAILITYVGFYFEAASSKAALLQMFETETANTPLEPSR
jgi:hypothetical protein